MQHNQDVAHAWHALSEYHACMSAIISAWQAFFKTDFKSDHFNREEMIEWSERVATTINILRDEYTYDTIRFLRLFPQASGFPERLHLHLLETKRQLVQTDSPPNLKHMKKLFLNQLFKTGRANHWWLERIAKTSAARQLLTEQTLTPFTVTRMQQRLGESGRTVFTCCFERYCYRHIPSLYLLVFEHDESEITAEEMSRLVDTLVSATSYFPKIGHFAQQIDKAFARIHPKWVGRVSLGPVFIANVTQDEHVLQQLLDEMTPVGTYQGIGRIINEFVLSAGEIPAGKLYDAQGHSHACLQQFAVRDIDSECLDRQVSEVHKHLFIPHRIIQAMDDEVRRELGHQIKILEV